MFALVCKTRPGCRGPFGNFLALNGDGNLICEAGAEWMDDLKKRLAGVVATAAGNVHEFALGKLLIATPASGGHTCRPARVCAALMRRTDKLALFRYSQSTMQR